MLREKIKFQGLVNMVTDVFVIFASYVIAVYIRYDVMESQPGLNTLSAPYLLIALTYSFIVANVLGVARSQKKKGPEDSGPYGLFSINAIGCLLLLAFLYTVGELYFSRWALVLFWLISSVLLFIKNISLAAFFGRKTREMSKRHRVVVIGSGENCSSYIRAVDFDWTCDINIVGYIGRKPDIFFDHEFEYNGSGEEDTEGWLGGYPEAEEILNRFSPDEAVFALENDEMGILDELLPAVKKMGIKASLLPCFDRYLPEDAVIRHMDGISIIDLCAGDGKQTVGLYEFGLSMSITFLMLMLIIKKFHIGNVKSFGLYESYRCFIFSMAGYFLYFSMGRIVGARKYRNTAVALLTALISAALITIYEAVYAWNWSFVHNMKPDLVMTAIVIAVCWVARSAVDCINKDDYWIMM